MTHDVFLGWPYYFLRVCERVEFAVPLEEDENLRVAGHSNIVAPMKEVVLPLAKLL